MINKSSCCLHYLWHVSGHEHHGTHLNLRWHSDLPSPANTMVLPSSVLQQGSGQHTQGVHALATGVARGAYRRTCTYPVAPWNQSPRYKAPVLANCCYRGIQDVWSKSWLQLVMFESRQGAPARSQDSITSDCTAGPLVWCCWRCCCARPAVAACCDSLA